MANQKTTWSFVENYYPNYYQCSDIARSDELDRILEGQDEMPENTIGRQCEIERSEVNERIYQKSIDGFLEHEEYFIFGECACRAARESGSVEEFARLIKDKDIGADWDVFAYKSSDPIQVFLDAQTGYHETKVINRSMYNDIVYKFINPKNT